MKNIILALVMLVLLVVSCSQTSSENTMQTAVAETKAIEGVIQTAIVETQDAMPTNTAEPTSTIPPTATTEPKITPRPTNTNTPDSNNSAIEKIISDISDLILAFSDTESITAIRRGEESFEIEVKTKYSAKDNQPDVSFQIIKIMSDVFGGTTEGKALNFVTGNPEHFSVFLTTYSSDGKYKYSSRTYFDTLVKLYNKQITYEEWVKASNAGFVE